MTRWNWTLLKNSRKNSVARLKTLVKNTVPKFRTKFFLKLIFPGRIPPPVSLQKCQNKKAGIIIHLILKLNQLAREPPGTLRRLPNWGFNYVPNPINFHLLVKLDFLWKERKVGSLQGSWAGGGSRAKRWPSWDHCMAYAAFTNWTASSQALTLPICFFVTSW